MASTGGYCASTTRRDEPTTETSHGHIRGPEIS
jgi:hypothetical protein